MLNLLDEFPKSGELVWIGVRSKRRAAVLSVAEVSADPKLGLIGDCYKGTSGKRQVTLIQQEHLAALNSFLGQSVEPQQLRRNLLVSGINVLSLKNCYFRIGDVLLEATGLCHPCSRMEKSLGAGGLNAMRGHGGITARIIDGGIMRIGDSVTPVKTDPSRFKPKM